MSKIVISDIIKGKSEGLNDRSINCYGNDLNGAQCNGFTLDLEGKDKSEGNINKLKEIIRGQDLQISKVIIRNTGGAIIITDFN